jgi:hypothetical protein
MALSIPNFPDPQDSATPIPAAYGWIADITISYADRRASLSYWAMRSPNAAATWPGGLRDEPAREIRISCGDPVPGYPDAVFPELDAVMARAAQIAAQWMAEAGEDGEAQSAALASIATGGAIRAALYAYLNELVFTGATPVD